jgi:hypothetical protein
MELHDLLRLRKSELIHAPEEKKEEIRKDIGRIRLAIATEKEVRAVACPSGTRPCGASAHAEKREALVCEDQEQWKFEAERRLAEVKTNE